MNDRTQGATNVLRDVTEQPVVPYEHQLLLNPEWALAEGSRHFDEKSAVYATLRKFTQRMDELGIPYAIAGGMALFQHGLRRFTEDVDVLVTRDGLKTIHRELDGRGYLPPFQRSKNLRDTELGVRIEFLISGEFPGDGKPKPVAFPDPQQVAVERGGLRVLDLPVLVELKLASGMTNPQRLRDLADVQDLIKTLRLPADFSTRLNPYVQPKFLEIWSATTGASSEPGHEP